jgi:hypothetical protein
MAGSRIPTLRQRILRLLANGKQWRLKHLVERAAKGETPAAVRNEVARLSEAGRISRVRWGVWILAGQRKPKKLDIPPLHRERVGGPTGRKVLERLAVPTPAPTLVAELGVTRQRIDQILKLLQGQGKVSRFREPTAGWRWFWVRSDVKTKKVPLRHATALSAGQADVLNVLEPGALHWVNDVVAAGMQSSTSAVKNIRVLEARGLITTGWAGELRYMGITRRGAEHPSRAPDHARCRVADMPTGFGERRHVYDC